MEKRKNDDLSKRLLGDVLCTSVETTDSYSEQEKCTSWMLYFVIFVVNLSFVSVGITIVWLSPASMKLTSTDSEENPLGRPISSTELPILGSLAQTGVVIGVLLFKKNFDKYGRLQCLIALNFLLVIFFSILALATTIVLYYISLFSIGLLVGSINVGVPMYISEVTEDHNRAKMSCFMALSIPVGNLFGYIIGNWFSLKTFTLLSAIPSLSLVVLSVLFLPESPVFLLMKGNAESAIIAVQYLLRCDIGTAIKTTKNIDFIICHTADLDKTSLKAIWLNAASRNGVITSSVLFILVSANLPVLMEYLEIIFQAAGTDFSVETSTIIIGVIQIVCFSAASFLIRKIGRRTLLLTATSISCFPHFVLGLYFFLKNNGVDLDGFKWVPLLCIVSLMVTLVTGLCSVTYIYITEVFACDVKSFALGLVHFISGISGALIAFLFPVVMNSIGLCWNFWFFCIICFLGFLFVYFRIPETKDRNLLEIQDLLSRGKSGYTAI